MTAAAAQVKTSFGSIDVLISNAGYLSPFTSILTSDPLDWWYTWEVNVKGTYLTARTFLPLVLASTEKTIVTVCSAGAWMTLTGGSAYESTKTAQIRFQNFLHREYSDQVREQLPDKF